jgi:hypothetical protein
MKSRKIIPQLFLLMERNNPDLLYIIMSFLKKLTVFGENKNEMVLELVNHFRKNLIL